MKKLWFLALAAAGVFGACSDAGGVDPDAIDDAEIIAVQSRKFPVNAVTR